VSLEDGIGERYEGGDFAFAADSSRTTPNLRGRGFFFVF